MHKTSLIMEKENHIKKLNEIIVELKDEIKQGKRAYGEQAAQLLNGAKRTIDIESENRDVLLQMHTVLS